LLPGVLLVPLIGAIDSQRAQQIISTILTAIGEHRSQTILLDVTGVRVVDTQVASSLIQTAQAATLLGARVVMVGIQNPLHCLAGSCPVVVHQRLTTIQGSGLRAWFGPVTLVYEWLAKKVCCGCAPLLWPRTKLDPHAG
jgi:ABC-type transporter Mla MlaB component